MTSHSFCGILPCRRFIFVMTWSVPRESLLVELDNNLWAAAIGLPRRYQISFICSFPEKQTDSNSEFERLRMRGKRRSRSGVVARMQAKAT
jgi:hypothetical protein